MRRNRRPADPACPPLLRRFIERELGRPVRDGPLWWPHAGEDADTLTPAEPPLPVALWPLRRSGDSAPADEEMPEGPNVATRSLRHHLLLSRVRGVAHEFWYGPHNRLFPRWVRICDRAKPHLRSLRRQPQCEWRELDNRRQCTFPANHEPATTHSFTRPLSRGEVRYGPGPPTRQHPEIPSSQRPP